MTTAVRPVTRRARRLVVALVLIAGAAGSATTVGTAAAAPTDTPTVTVTPAVVTHGQTVSIATSGLVPGPASYSVMQCWARSEDTPFPAYWEDCRFLAGYQDDRLPPATVEATVEERFAPRYEGPTVDCVTDVGGCIVGVFRLADGLHELLAYDRLTFPPRLDVAPTRNLGDGDTVAVTAEGVPPGDWSVVQCTAAVVDTRDTTPPGSCGEPTPLALTGSSVAGTVVTHDPLIATDGSTVPCGPGGCALVLVSSADPFRTFGRIGFGPPAMTVAPFAPLFPWDSVDVTVTGMPGDTVTLWGCRPPFGPDTCVGGEGQRVVLDDLGNGSIEAGVSVAFLDGSGHEVTCWDALCSLVAESNGEYLASVPLTFRPQVSVTLTPSSGLIDGQPILVESTGQVPGEVVTVRRCFSDCDVLAELPVPASGQVSTTVVAEQRLGDTGYCRRQCFISVDPGFSAMYSMAEGHVAVDPAGGLADGDTVQVTGSDLQPTYPGRLLGPFPTGGAAVVQCATTAAAVPGLFAALDGCGAATARPLTITAPEVEEPLTVRATLTSFTGRTIDCTAPGSCVVGIYRLEQDGSSTFTGSPVTFG